MVGRSVRWCVAYVVKCIKMAKGCTIGREDYSKTNNPCRLLLSLRTFLSVFSTFDKPVTCVPISRAIMRCRVGDSRCGPLKNRWCGPSRSSLRVCSLKMPSYTRYYWGLLLSSLPPTYTILTHIIGLLGFLWALMNLARARGDLIEAQGPQQVPRCLNLEVS